MTIITRFAPSPTGYLHIGGARTALFNWLLARHQGGKFLLRIEDTDHERSTSEAKAAIIAGLAWLGLDHDGNVVHQSERADRHKEVARDLLAKGKAYKCYATSEELVEMRTNARAEGRSIVYDGRWRDRDQSEAPVGIDPVVRLKAPRHGKTTVSDYVQGDVTFQNSQLDDMVLLRGDSTPTYMLSVVVDDHDMGITHIMRGDDHLNNAARQMQLYNALDWETPNFSHIPLIHGEDGSKLSKRHGALGIEAYREMGYLPEAMINYLLRLGWSHGDDEVIPLDDAIKWFNIEGLGKSPARLDLKKLDYLNGHYIREANNRLLVDLVSTLLTENFNRQLVECDIERLNNAIPLLKSRVKTISELAENSVFLIETRPLTIYKDASSLLNPEALKQLSRFFDAAIMWSDWSNEGIETSLREFADSEGLKLGKIAQPLRAALTGRTKSPGIFDVLAILGRDETLGRVTDALTSAAESHGAEIA